MIEALIGLFVVGVIGLVVWAVFKTDEAEDPLAAELKKSSSMHKESVESAAADRPMRRDSEDPPPRSGAPLGGIGSPGGIGDGGGAGSGIGGGSPGGDGGGAAGGAGGM